MPDSSDPDPTPSEDLVRLARAVETLNAQTFFRLQDQVARTLVRQFLRGIAFGLGSVLGATIVVSMLVYSLSQIDFIPIIGEWAARIAERIQTR
jgi:hypothetical protein